MLQTHILPVLEDNYVFVLEDTESATYGVVDPAVAEPVRQFLEDRQATLSIILNTHHHWDHIGGNLELKDHYGCAIFGSKSDHRRIPGIDHKLEEGDTVQLGSSTAQVFSVDGHTKGHIAYWFDGDRSLFCGDTLFGMGCGRLFEGSPAQMWESLQKLRRLPDDTEVYCAHEYTETNLAFALSVEPKNPSLAERAQEVKRVRSAGKPTIPTNIGLEKATNPFLRADQRDYIEQCPWPEATDLERYTRLRELKDRF